MTSQDFSSVKVGDVLWSIELSECEVTEICSSYIELTSTDESGDYAEYNFKGFHHPDMSNDIDFVLNKNQSLFWSKPEIKIPENPRRKIRLGALYWANIYRGHVEIFKSADEAERSVSNQYYIIATAVKLTGEYEVYDDE